MVSGRCSAVIGFLDLDREVYSGIAHKISDNPRFARCLVARKSYGVYRIQVLLFRSPRKHCAVDEFVALPRHVVEATASADLRGKLHSR